MTGLSLDDSGRIGFVVAALISGAIDVPEVRRWAEHVLGEIDEYANWIDLIEFDDATFHICQVIGFSPSASLSAGEDSALKGIELARGRTIDTTICSQYKAIDALHRNSDLLERFRGEFPFLADTINEAIEPPQFEEPWEAVTSDFSGELKKEVPIGHILYGVPTMAIARRCDCDDFLFKLDDDSGRYAIVHLTWRKEVDPAWPATEMLDAWNAIVEVLSDRD